MGFRPGTTHFKPAGAPVSGLEEIVLSVDEYEALRLKDLLGIGQAGAAEKMDVSQPTFHRTLINARKKVADAIVNGKAIRIQGGNIHFSPPRGGAKPMSCVCPKCGHKQAKLLGIPCFDMQCPKCMSKMVRSS